jgi:VanZ like family
MQRRWGRVAAAVGLLVILAATLAPEPSQSRAAEATPLWCLVCGEYGGVDVLNNILLFIPFAIGLRLTGFPRQTVVMAGALLSLGIETLQLLAIPGRDASLSDVLTNTLGTWLGAVAGDCWRTLLCPRSRHALQLACGASAGWLVLQIGTALLLRPWIPVGPLQSEWRPDTPGRLPFSGMVTSASVSGMEVAPGPVDSSAELSRRLGRGRISLRLELRAGDTATHWSTVYRLTGPHGPVLQVDALGSHLVFQPPAVAQLLRLRAPRLLVENVLSPATSVTLIARERHDTVWGRAGPLSGRGASYVLSPSQSWTLMSPFLYAYGREARLVTGCWLALLLGVIGYWWAQALAWPRGLATGTLVVGLGLGLVPLIFRYPVVHWSEWLGGLLGMVGGCALANGGPYFGKTCDSPFIRESS